MRATHARQLRRRADRPPIINPGTPGGGGCAVIDLYRLSLWRGWLALLEVLFWDLAFKRSLWLDISELMFHKIAQLVAPLRF